MTLDLSSGLRKIGFLGVLSLVSCLPCFGQGAPPLVCSASASAVPVRAGGAAERTSDLVVTCTGGFPTGEGQTVQPMTWILTFAATATSRPLATGWSDALLVVDEPQPSSQVACLTANGLCSIAGTGVPQRTYDGSAGHPNIFQGEYSANTLIWRGIPLDPPGTNLTRTFRFTNLRVATPLAGGTIAVTVSQPSGQLFVNLTNGTQAVAVAQTAITGSASGAGTSGGRLSKFTVNVVEQFANALKPGSAVGPSPSAQSSPGGVPFSFETGFYNPNLGGSSRGNQFFAGLPDNGTRVRVRFGSVPTTATVSAPLSINFGTNGTAQLIVADLNGVGNYSAASVNTLPNDKGVVTAVYEITQSSTTDVETLPIPFTFAYATGAPFLQTVSGDVALAPVSASQIADASPIPRFNNPLAFTVTAPRDPLSFVSTSLLNGAVGAAYTQTIGTAGGVQPYTFSSSPATPAPGITLTSAGVLTGTPTSSGTFGFSVTVRDSAQASLTSQFSLTIGAAGSLLQTSLSKLDFSAILGGSAPPVQVFRVGSSQTGQGFVVTLDNGSGSSTGLSWIQVSPSSGTAPGLITVSVNQANLSEGTYSARVRVSIPTNPNVAPVDVLVTLVVKAAPPLLESSVSRLTFTTRAPSPAKQQGVLLLHNAGGGGGFPFSTTVLQRSSWITSVSPASGGVSGPLETLIKINIDSTGLAEGIYRDVVRFTSATNNVDVAVVLRVTPAGPLLDVSPTGIRFSMREGAVTLAVRQVKIFNREPGSNLPWTAEWIRGSEYFTSSAVNGVATLTVPGILKVSTRPETASLASGAYYGLLRISAPSSAFTPRYVVAVLQVRPASQPSDLDLDTGGLVFTSLTGGQQARRVVTLNAASQSALAFQAAATTLDGTGWLSVSPNGGNLTSAQSAALAVGVDPRTLAAGIYRGEITVATADTSQTLAATLIVTDAASDPVPSKARAAKCSANRMAVGTTGLANNFSVPAGWPATLTVEVRDNCGAAVSNATVVARFSNGDPPMTLDADDVTGIYTGTWQPGTPIDQTNVTISALNSDFPEARATLIGSVKANSVPTLARGGTVNPFNRQASGLLAPGTPVEVYGNALASVVEGTFVPLPIQYKGSSVLIGPYDAPLYFVTPGQLNVQLPSELAPNRSYPIVVSSGGAISIPDTLDVVPIQPGVASFTDGKIIAQHSNYVLVDAQNPAKRGEYLIMYLVGLGATNPPVASGALSPSIEPLGRPLSPATVTMDGNPVDILFSGLTPAGVGLYQINFRVPDNARLNTPLEVLVKQGGYTANVTTLTVVP